MAINVLNTTNNADFVPEIWMNEALLRLRNQLHLVPNVTKDSELTTAFTVGDILNIPKNGTLTAQAKTQGGNITLQTPSSSKVSVTLDKHYHVAIAVSDVLAAQANQDVMNGYLGDGIGVLAEQVESDVAALYASAAYEVGAAGADIDESVVLAARQKLNSLNAPSEGRILVVSPKDETALLKIDRFTSAEKIGVAGKIAAGAIGRIHGFDVFQSNLIALTAAPATYHNFAFLRRGIVLASRPLPAIKGAISIQQADPFSGLVMRVTYGYNAQQNQDQVVIDVLYGCGVLREEFFVEVLS